MTEEEAQRIINSIDKDKSGKIDFNEFMIVSYSREKLFIKESLSEAFDFLDHDGTGFIEVKELKSILKGSDKAEIDYLVAAIDKDRDNRISREEFIDYLLE